MCGVIYMRAPHIVAFGILTAAALKRPDEYEALMAAVPDLEMNFIVLSSLYTVYVFLPIVTTFCLSLKTCCSMLKYIVNPFACLFGFAMCVGSIAQVVFAALTLNITYNDEAWLGMYALNVIPETGSSEMLVLMRCIIALCWLALAPWLVGCSCCVCCMCCMCMGALKGGHDMAGDANKTQDGTEMV